MRDARRAVRLVLGILGVSCVVLAQAPAPPARDGVIAGVVVDAATSRPVSAAVVSIAATGTSLRGGPQGLPPAGPRILTGADGRFLFKDLAAGSFYVSVIKGGYADGAYGRKRPGGVAQPVMLTAADNAVDISVPLWRNGALTGTVTDEAGEPVVGLQVRALARSASLAGSQDANDPAGFVRVGSRPFIAVASPAMTDDRGMYRFGNLTPGEYIVMAGPPLMSATRNIFSDVARTGRGTGELLALTAGGAAGAPLQIGDALVSVGRGAALPPPPAGSRMQIYPPTFYPSGLLPGQASVIALGSGDERTAIDIELAPVATARVSGTLMTAAGPLGMVTLRLMPAGAEGVPLDSVAPASVADGAGGFIFNGVVPGRYSLRGSTSGGAAGMAWLDMPVTVGGDNIDGMIAMMNPALQITGRLQFDGATPPPPAPAAGRPVMNVPFILDPADVASGPDQVSVAIAGGDRGFTVTGYRPGRYRVRVPNSPPGWMFRAAMLNGVDVSETPFDLARSVTDLVLTFSDRWSGMSGAVRGAGSAGATVLVFPLDAQKWTTAGWSPRRVRSTRADGRGRFGMSSLPPGDYYAIAIAEEPAGDWRDPSTLDALARIAVQVTIVEGEHRTLDLTLREFRQ